jgi:hypothetical protein
VALGLIAGLASFALQGASALAGHDAQADQRRANARNALRAYRMNIADLGERARQAEQSAAQEFGLYERQGTAAASTASAAAAEAGVAGGSVTGLLQKYAMETRAAQAASGATLDNTMGELSRRAEGAFVEYQGRVDAVPAPSGLATALSLAPGALDLLRLTGGGPRSASSTRPSPYALGRNPNAVPGR